MILCLLLTTSMSPLASLYYIFCSRIEIFMSNTLREGNQWADFHAKMEAYSNDRLLNFDDPQTGLTTSMLTFLRH